LLRGMQFDLYLEEIVSGHSRFPGDASSHDNHIGARQSLFESAIGGEIASNLGLGVDVHQVGRDAGHVDEIVQRDFIEEIALVDCQCTMFSFLRGARGTAMRGEDDGLLTALQRRLRGVPIWPAAPRRAILTMATVYVVVVVVVVVVAVVVGNGLCLTKAMAEEEQTEEKQNEIRVSYANAMPNYE
jgi:hypothetical protein